MTVIQKHSQSLAVLALFAVAFALALHGHDGAAALVSAASLVPFQLPSITYTAGGNDTIPLKDLPVQLRGRIPHVVKFLFELDFTPTYSSGTGSTVGNNNVFTAVDFWDGSLLRFTGGMNAMRAKERLSCGNLRIPDADTDTASATARYVRRVLHVGPPHFLGAPGDFQIPTGMLSGGELRATMGALTDIDANCTACTATLRTTAWLQLMDEVRIPPAYQFQRLVANSPDVPLPSRALFESLSLLNSSSYDAISAGDFGNFRLDFGFGDVVPSIRGDILQTSYQDDMLSREIGAFGGEPRGASDDNGKSVNHASPTALAAAPNDIQVVWWAGGQQAKISKLELCESAARLQWDGSQASAVVLIGRFLPQPQSVVGRLAAQALAPLKRGYKSIKIKTLSKQPYSGPLVEFMPFKVEI